MTTPNLHVTLLRPPIIQILRAAGFHSTRPAVIDTLADITSRYLLLLASSTTQHASNSHPVESTPTLDDILMALYEAGALRPQLSPMEEEQQGEEDMRGLETFLSWFSGPANTEIRRVAGFIAGEGEVVDQDSLEKEDYLTTLKKKHSKTGEESRFQGTILGKDAEERPVVIEGGAESIQAWGAQIKSREQIPESGSSTISSLSSNVSMSESMDMKDDFAFQ